MPNSKTVAIMQPYFIPYTGYFRLIAQSDLFVVYDCVQFPRRGWVHRNKLLNAAGEEDWLTLPLTKAPQDVLIKDLEFPIDARNALAERLKPFSLPAKEIALQAEIMGRVLDIQGSVVDYIEGLLKYAVNHMGFAWNSVRSSSLNVPDSFRGQDRIIEIARRVGATCYLNAPGGTELYDAASFADAGMELNFLPPYQGKGGSILPRLLNEDRDHIVLDIQDKRPMMEKNYA